MIDDNDYLFDPEIRQFDTYFEKGIKERKDKGLDIQKAERNKLLYNWGIKSGGRVSEVLAIDLAKDNPEEMIIAVAVKGQRMGKLMYTPELMEMTKTFMYKYKRGETKVFNIDRFQADHIIKEAGKACNIKGKNVRCHILRHTFARRLLKAQVPISMVSKMMNHKDPSITAKEYSAFADPEVKQAYQSAMSRII